jgi:hypothetical protein
MRNISSVAIACLLSVSLAAPAQNRQVPIGAGGTVYRGDTNEPFPGVRLRPEPVEIPKGFDKPCRAVTGTDVSEGGAVMTDADGRFELEPRAPGTGVRRPQTAANEAVLRILEMEKLRMLLQGGVLGIEQERVDRQRIPQETIDAITGPGTVPLAVRNSFRTGLIAEREGFVQAAGRWPGSGVDQPA